MKPHNECGCHQGKRWVLWEPGAPGYGESKVNELGGEREVYACVKALRVGKGLLFLIYDFPHNYRSDITSLYWTFSVGPTALSPSSSALLSAHEADLHEPLVGIP